jgi:hypothetical protein
MLSENSPRMGVSNPRAEIIKPARYIRERLDSGLM